MKATTTKYLLKLSLLLGLGCGWSIQAQVISAFDTTLRPKEFSAQDAALYVHQLNLALTGLKAEAETYQTTVVYLTDYRTRLARKAQLSGLLPFEEQMQQQLVARGAATQTSLAALELRIGGLQRAAAKWGKQSDPASLVQLEPSFRLFPELKPLPSLYLPLVDRQRLQFQFTATTKNLLRL